MKSEWFLLLQKVAVAVANFVGGLLLVSTMKLCLQTEERRSAELVALPRLVRAHLCVRLGHIPCLGVRGPFHRMCQYSPDVHLPVAPRNDPGLDSSVGDILGQDFHTPETTQSANLRQPHSNFARRCPLCTWGNGRIIFIWPLRIDVRGHCASSPHDRTGTGVPWSNG